MRDIDERKDFGELGNNKIRIFEGFEIWLFSYSYFSGIVQDGHTSTPAEDDVEYDTVWVAPDGGWGWWVLFGSIVVNILIPGTVKSFGVLFIEFIEAFDASPSAAAWIPALSYWLYSSTGNIEAHSIQIGIHAQNQYLERKSNFCFHFCNYNRSVCQCFSCQILVSDGDHRGWAFGVGWPLSELLCNFNHVSLRQVIMVDFSNC